MRNLSRVDHDDARMFVKVLFAHGCLGMLVDAQEQFVHECSRTSLALDEQNNALKNISHFMNCLDELC